MTVIIKCGLAITWQKGPWPVLRYCGVFQEGVLRSSLLSEIPKAGVPNTEQQRCEYPVEVGRLLSDKYPLSVA
jgi:hypothetical protein